MKPIVRDICSVYIIKGRVNNTASKLVQSDQKCIRVAKELSILDKRFRLC